MIKRTGCGFTLVELMIVLAGISVLAGFSFHLGQQAKNQANLLSKKADGLRYQEAFLNYFQTHQRFPSAFPTDRWFNLSDKATLFIDILSGQIKTADNPDGTAFGEFTAEEILTKKITDVRFFLRRNTSLQNAIASNLNPAEVYGTDVIFYLENI